MKEIKIFPDLSSKKKYLSKFNKYEFPIYIVLNTFFIKILKKKIYIKRLNITVYSKIKYNSQL